MDLTSLSLQDHFVSIHLKGRRKDEWITGWARDDHPVAGKKFVRVLPMADGVVQDKQIVLNPDSIEQIDVLHEPGGNEEYDLLFREYHERTNAAVHEEEDYALLLQTEEGRLRIAQGNKIREQVNKVSFANIALPPRYVSRNELAPGVQLSVDIEDPPPNAVITKCSKPRKKSTAMAIDRSGSITSVKGSEYAVFVQVHSTKPYEKRVEELMANNYAMPSIFKKTVGLEAHTERDKMFLALCEAAVAKTDQKVLLEQVPTKDDLLAIIHPPSDSDDDQFVSPYYALMSKVAYGIPGLDGALKESDIRPIQSVKSSLFDTFESNRLSKTVIWILSPPHLLGDNVYYGDYVIWNQWADEDNKLYQFRGWEFAGMGLKDVCAVTKVVVHF